MAVLISSVLLLACGKDATGPTPPAYETIAGTYAGSIAGLVQGVQLTGNFSLTIGQNQGALSGTYAITGALTDGVVTVPIQGTGTITGTIASRSNPSVNVTIRTAFCPNYSAVFSGAYDTANRRLTLSGPVDILESNCTVFLRYPSVLILTR